MALRFCALTARPIENCGWELVETIGHCGRDAVKKWLAVSLIAGPCTVLAEVPMQCVRHFPAAVAALAWLGCGTGTIDAAPGPKDGAPGEAGGSVLGGGGDQGPGGGAGSAGNAGVDTSAGGTSDTGGGTAAGGAAGATVVPPPPANVSPKDLATKLGLPVQFAWGLGNDGDVIYRPELDAAKLHYKYFTWGWGGWEQPAGQYAKRFLTECTTAGKLPVITFYQATSGGSSKTPS
jgi:hypothetical protein